jgi:hypothetical protein
VRCYVREVPIVNVRLEKMLQEGGQPPTATLVRPPFSNVRVAGTGNFVCAKLCGTFAFQL